MDGICLTSLNKTSWPSLQSIHEHHSHGGVSNLIASAAAKLIYWLSIEKSQYTNYMSDFLLYFYNRVTGECLYLTECKIVSRLVVGAATPA